MAYVSLIIYSLLLDYPLHIQNYCGTWCYTLVVHEGLQMRVFKNKAVSKWAAKEGLTDKALLEAVGEMERG